MRRIDFFKQISKITIENNNKKIKQLTISLLRINLLLLLLSTMILDYYLSTDILFYYNLGLTLLKLGISFFSYIAINYFAFSKIETEL